MSTAKREPEWEACAVCGAFPLYDVYGLPAALGIVCDVRCASHLLVARIELIAPNGALALDIGRRAWNAMQRDERGETVRRAWVALREARLMREDAARESAA